MPQKKPRKKDRDLGRYAYKATFSKKEYKIHQKKNNETGYSKLQETEMEKIHFNKTTNNLNTQINANGDVEDIDEEELVRLDKIKKYQNLLAVPKRPLNARNMTKDELFKSEEENYGAWRRNLESLPLETKIKMTPFECNLNFWRQLWRVIERSNILIQVVDSRHPLVYRNRDLEAYVKEVDPNKLNVILINKSDYLTESQRKIWAEYFNEQNIRVIFWSATLVSEKKNQSQESDTINKLESLTKELNECCEDQSSKHGDGESDESTVDEDSQSEESTADEDSEKDDLVVTGIDKIEHDESNVNEDSEQDDLVVTGIDKIEHDESTVEEDSEKDDLVVTESDKIELDDSNKLSDENQIKNSHLIVGVDELLNILETMPLKNHEKEDKVVVGLIGYPNVGKSSTVNAIYGAKKASVSTTPGRTKHFQTLNISDKLIFCDCPGLVMPSIVNSRAELALTGILNLNTLQDFVSPMNEVAKRFPRSTFEALYGINIISPPRNEDPNRPPTGREVLSAYSFMHSMVGSKGNPNLDKAARIMLKDYVSGKLLYRHPPPNYTPEEYGSPADIPLKKTNKYLKRKENMADKNTEEPFIPFTRPDNSNAQQSTASCVVKPNSYRTAIDNNRLIYGVGVNPDEVVVKPWRNKGKREKKEKARNKYKHLDQQPYVAD